MKMRELIEGREILESKPGSFESEFERIVSDFMKIEDRVSDAAAEMYRMSNHREFDERSKDALNDIAGDLRGMSMSHFSKSAVTLIRSLDKLKGIMRLHRAKTDRRVPRR